MGATAPHFLIKNVDEYDFVVLRSTEPWISALGTLRNARYCLKSQRTTC
jgi:hypothetical protein